MFKSTSVHVAALVLAACVQGAMPPAQAADTDTRSAEVRTADLDLASPSGVSLLRHRLNRAARQVCGPPGLVGTTDDDAFLECVHAAMLDAAHEADRRIAAARSALLFAASGNPK